MKLQQISRHKETMRYDDPADCIIVFLLIFIPLLIISISLKYCSDVICHMALFFTGWMGWTFTEYMAHRYLMHSAGNENQVIDFNHAWHHAHPTDIKISGIQRCLLVVACIILLAVSVWLHNYFTLAAGFLSGIPVYTLMHFFLHQEIARKIFRKLVKYHMYHHCKYPDKCFGISVTWWDDLFKTVPLNPGVISHRIIDFYLVHTNEKPGNPHPKHAQKIAINTSRLKR